MILFKILAIAILVIELIITFLVKFNVKGIQDNLYNRVKNKSLEHYIRYEYPARAIISNSILLIIFILALC